MNSSILGSMISEQLFCNETVNQPVNGLTPEYYGISTVSGLARAAKAGQKIYQLTSKNINTASFASSGADMSNDIAKTINNGGTVLELLKPKVNKKFCTYYANLLVITKVLWLFIKTGFLKIIKAVLGHIQRIIDSFLSFNDYLNAGCDFMQALGFAILRLWLATSFTLLVGFTTACTCSRNIFSYCLDYIYGLSIERNV